MMLHKESAKVLRDGSAVGILGDWVTGKREPALGAAHGAVSQGKLPLWGYLHELCGSPAHGLGGRDQSFRPARVLGVKLLSCCCPLLLREYYGLD